MRAFQLALIHFVVEQNSAVIQQLDIGVIFLQGGRDEVF